MIPRKSITDGSSNTFLIEVKSAGRFLARRGIRLPLDARTSRDFVAYSRNLLIRSITSCALIGILLAQLALAVFIVLPAILHDEEKAESLLALQLAIGMLTTTPIYVLNLIATIKTLPERRNPSYPTYQAGYVALTIRDESLTNEWLALNKGLIHLAGPTATSVVKKAEVWR